jgi:ArsR family transcriptional regulator
MSIKSNLNLLKALSEESRYRIINVLLRGERCACEIPSLIKRKQSNTSMHLSRLVELGILESRRDGKKIIYSVKDTRVCDVFKALGDDAGIVLKRACCMNGGCNK